MSTSVFQLIVLCVSTLKAMKKQVKTVLFVHIADEYDSNLVVKHYLRHCAIFLQSWTWIPASWQASV